MVLLLYDIVGLFSCLLEFCLMFIGFAGCLFVSLVYCYLSIWLYSLLVVLVKFCLFAN